jgi:hypothetical protein
MRWQRLTRQTIRGQWTSWQINTLPMSGEVNQIAANMGIPLMVPGASDPAARLAYGLTFSPPLAP